MTNDEKNELLNLRNEVNRLRFMMLALYSLGLSRQQASILETLWTDGIVPTAALYKASRTRHIHQKIVDLLIYRIRRKLPQCEIENHKGRGYELTRKGRQWLTMQQQNRTLSTGIIRGRLTDSNTMLG
jgi:DNA-binding response OmpR family regulator